MKSREFEMDFVHGCLQYCQAPNGCLPGCGCVVVLRILPCWRQGMIYRSNYTRKGSIKTKDENTRRGTERVAVVSLFPERLTSDT